MTTSEKPLPARVANFLPEFEECTEQILGSAEIIARICGDDEDTALGELERFLHALQVVTFYMMRVEDDMRNPREIPVLPCTHEPGNRKAPEVVITPEEIRQLAGSKLISTDDIAAWIRELAARGWSQQHIWEYFFRPAPPVAELSARQLRQQMRDMDDADAAMKAAFGTIEDARQRNQPPLLTDEQSAAMKAAMAAEFDKFADGS